MTTDTETSMSRKDKNMSQPKSQKKTIVVAGDVAIDWNIASQQGLGSRGYDFSRDAWARAYEQKGGAFLLADLIGSIIGNPSQETEYDLFQIHPPTDNTFPSDNRFHHAYALWSPFEEKGERVWRITSHLGLDRRSENAPEFGDWNQVENDPPDADLIILNDEGYGFRNCRDLWPKALTSREFKPWVLLKMARPVAQGALWDYLQDHHAERLIVVTTAQDLRQTEVQISQGLSWERTAQDIAWELVYNPQVNDFSRCAAVVVSFDTAGAFLLSRLGKGTGQEVSEKAASQYRLFFDPMVIEGMWKEAHPGGMTGYTACLTAGIVHQLIRTLDQPAIQSGIQAGLAAMRRLHLKGYHLEEINENTQLSFPVEEIIAELAKADSSFSVVNVQGPFEYLVKPAGEVGGSEKEWWTILNDRHRDHLYLLAEEIVRKGPEAALDDVPLGLFGHMLTVDRQEIESYRSIYAFAEDLNEEQASKPLSLAVFGAPGSGKSFGVTQVAKSLAPGQIEVLQFNLSQFESSQELMDAMHLIRDINLSGKIPLVFWDEFDSALDGNPLGWLRYFLAPMQDGEFRQGQATHPIGRAIFVFIGGTSHRMQDFGKGLSEDALRAMKVPDFLSRLKGYVNVLGPNPPEDESSRTEGTRDSFHLIRRAILLRSLLGRKAPHLFQKKDGHKVLQIDNGVLRAFLLVKKFKHGIRSIVSVITMSQLAGRTSYQRSSLPPEGQLDLHVDGQKFLALVHEVELTGDLLEELAKAHHRISSVNREEAKPSLARPYLELDADEKNQNRDAVRTIPQKLASIGYIMIPVRSNTPPFHFPQDSNELEKLAQMEYERQRRIKQSDGLPDANGDKKKTSKALPLWDELSDEQQEKSRDLMRLIPQILGQAGYTMVKLH